MTNGLGAFNSKFNTVDTGDQKVKDGDKEKALVKGETNTKDITQQELAVELAKEYNIDNASAEKIAAYLIRVHGGDDKKLDSSEFSNIVGQDLGDLALLAEYDTDGSGDITYAELKEQFGIDTAQSIYKDLGLEIDDPISTPEDFDGLANSPHIELTDTGDVNKTNFIDVSVAEAAEALPEGLPIALLLAWVFQNAKDLREDQLTALAESLQLNTADTKKLNDILASIVQLEDDETVSLTPDQAQFLLDQGVGGDKDEYINLLEHVANNPDKSKAHEVKISDEAEGKLTGKEFESLIQGQIDQNSSVSSTFQTEIQQLNQDIQTFLQSITSLIKGHGERNETVGRNIK